MNNGCHVHSYLRGYEEVAWRGMLQNKSNHYDENEAQLQWLRPPDKVSL